MNGDLPSDPKFRGTMDRLENVRRQAETGSEYWLAREIQGVLGYEEWRNFKKIVRKAHDAIEANEISPSQHIVETTKMMELGNDAHREVMDYFLSRAACYLIAMNGDSSKPEIAGAQAYFAARTRASEVADAQGDDEKRLALREKVTKSFKVVSGVAQDAGVSNKRQAIFHDARYQGLYGMSGRDVKTAKGIDQKANAFDFMGALELSANDFQMNLAAETIKKENVRGETKAIDKNKEVAARVRRTMIDSGSRPPEKLPKDEPIKEVVKRVKANAKKRIAYD